MIALKNYNSGEGNTSQCIAQAEGYRDTLYYKHEKSLSFSNFLDKIQKLFSMFQEEGESITKQAKVRMLLKKIQHPQLQNAVSAFCIRAQLDSVSFTECANHLSAIVSELPDHLFHHKHLQTLVTSTQQGIATGRCTRPMWVFDVEAPSPSPKESGFLSAEGLDGRALTNVSELPQERV